MINYFRKAVLPAFLGGLLFFPSLLSAEPQFFYGKVFNSIAFKVKYSNTPLALTLTDKVINRTKTEPALASVRCNAFIIQCLCYSNTGKYEMALTAFDSAQAGAKKIESRELYSQVLYAKGLLFTELENYQEAFSAFYTAVSLCNEPRILGMIYNDIGRAHRLNDDDSSAFRYFTLAYEKGVETSDSNRIAISMNNLGNLYKSKKNYDKALEYYNRSLRIRTMLGDTLGITSVLINMALVYDKLGKTDEALEANLWVLEMSVKNSWHDNEVIAKNNIGVIYMTQGKYTQAITILENAFAVADTNKLFYLGKRSGLILAELYAKQHDYKQSLESYKRYTAFSNSDNKQKMQQNAQIYDARYRLSLNQQKIELLKSEQAAADYNAKLQEKELSERKLQLIILGIVFLFAAFLLTVIFRRNRLYQKLNNKLKLLIEQREILIREVHHRVKNNLQLVSSLLSLHASKSEQTGREMLIESQNRIHTLALLHEKLYQSESLSNISLRDYVQQVTSDLLQSFSIEQEKIKLICEVDDIYCDIEKLVPCGLIINELVTNSLKHAFVNERERKITVKVYMQGEQLRLEISDNGKGFDESARISLGMRLVNGLVKQLKGTIQQIRASEPGTRFEIDFPLQPKIR
jgi:two-component sensor histidine kinase